MTNATTYTVKTLNDLLKVPHERRAALFKELERALLLFELVHEGDPAGAPPFTLVWADDGCDDTAIHDEAGRMLLRMDITKHQSSALAAANAPAQAATTEATTGEPAAL